jgi:hypothetical protein
MNIRTWPALMEWLIVAFVAGSITPTANSQETTDPLADRDRQAVYPVNRFLLEYGPRGIPPHPELPSLDDLLQVQVTLLYSGGTYFAREPDGEDTTLRLIDMIQPTRFSASAIVAINQALTRELNRRGFYGVWATPDPADINPQTGEDLREERQELRLLVYAVEIQQVRTIAKGQRFPTHQSTNHPAHRRVLVNSPLQPPQAEERGSTLFKSRLDDYVGRLNRFPGRSAAAALGPADTPNGLTLDYLISEDRPWTVYAQVSNTGTEASGRWRERFGFIHQQLTRRDDILSLDYVTADFQHSHAVFGSYEVPILYPDRVKAKVFGSYAEFTADELGLGSLSLDGSQWSAGGDVTWSPDSFAGPNIGRLGHDRVYLDFTMGARWQGAEINNQIFGIQAGTDLFLPYAGIVLSGSSSATRFIGGVQIEGNVAEIAGTDRQDLANLGRLDTDRDWVLAKWGAGYSFFLEPLVVRHPEKLVHELSFSSHGQYVFGERRLIPQQTALIGGMYSVRGYPEALDLGDTVVVGTAEYRFHLARALMPVTEEKRRVGAKQTARAQFENPFRFRSGDAFSRPNWDVVVRAFVDGGKSYHNRRQPMETDRDLLSAGVGVDLQLWRNLTVRGDYGVALRSEEQNLARRVKSGDGRVHFSATLSW